MAAYVKQADQFVILFSKAEAKALCDFIRRAKVTIDRDFETDELNNSTAAALNRAIRTVETVCEPGSRSGAAIQ